LVIHAYFLPRNARCWHGSALFLQTVLHESTGGSQRTFSLGLGVVLLILGAIVALISARQFRQVTKALAPAVVPPGYWTNVGVALNLTIALIALLLAAHFLLSTP
jgi:putative membrane protein